MDEATKADLKANVSWKCQFCEREYPARDWPKAVYCPGCGYHGGGHVTVFREGQIGRRCLDCGSTWPIAVEATS